MTQTEMSARSPDALGGATPQATAWWSGRVGAALCLGGGIACLTGALAVAGGVAAVLLDALDGGAGDCTGALLVPVALLGLAALAGLAGLALATLGGVWFWCLAGAARR